MNDDKPAPCPRCGGRGLIDLGEQMLVACGCPAGERVSERISADIRKEADKLDD